MKKFLTMIPLAVALAAVATPAFADDDDDRRGWRSWGENHQGDDDDDRRWDRRRGDDSRWRYGDRDDHRYRHDRDDDRRYSRDRDRDWRDRYDDRDRRYHPRSGHWDNGRRGPPPWARGRDYRSYDYRNIYYVPVNDYARYRLYRPDYGYRWMRDDSNNFLLVAITSGIIREVLSPRW